MNKTIRYIGLILLTILMVACQGTKEERVLKQRQAVAEKQTEILCEALLHNAPMDSIRSIAEAQDELFFYVFDARQMVYWSSNRLTSGAVYLSSYDTWRELAFSNAKTMARWSKAGIYNVLTVIPLQYLEPQEYIDENTLSSQTFSFRQLIESDTKTYAKSRLYYYLCHVLFGLVILIGIIGLIAHKGIRNMRLSTRIMYIVMTPVLAVFIYIFVMSIRYVHRTNEQHQRHDLQMRSEYVQSFLRSLYYWDVALTSDQAQGLAIDLHDLGYDMNQDIHVYGLNGELLASSSPMLFNSGVLSRRMAPEAIF